jgi:uncharacterized membrane protein
MSLAKLTAILAAILIIAFGLCTATSMRGGTAATVGAISGGIALICFFALIVVGLIAIFRPPLKRNVMPDPLPSPTTKPRRSTGLKIIVFAACAAILSLGLCRVGFYLGRNVHDGAPSGIDTLGGIALLLSVIALAVGILITIIEAISNSSHKREP